MKHDQKLSAYGIGVIQFFAIVTVLFSCAKLSGGDTASNEGVSDSNVISVYSSLDTVMTCDSKRLKLSIRQFDVTDEARTAGDTTSRPTFTCTIKMWNSAGKLLLSDSLARDSWGYEGKIQSINSYVLGFPMFYCEGQTLIFSFRVYEESYEDAIEGLVSYEIAKEESSYSWREATEVE
jgi:hypothetical protein